MLLQPRKHDFRAFQRCKKEKNYHYFYNYLSIREICNRKIRAILLADNLLVNLEGTLQV